MRRAKKKGVKNSFFHKAVPLRIKLLFIFGMSCLLFFFSWKIHEKSVLSFVSRPAFIRHQNATHFPILLSIPSIHISLSVHETNIIGNIWQIADNGLSHLAISGYPGENSTSVFYGHNTIDKLANLPYVQTGAQITIITADKTIYHYRITQTEIVNPNQTDVLTNQTGETLIVYTCYGLFDNQRFLAIAKPENK
ncbi:MAG TPA: sortase [Patescibacteria group bacterium]|nr:sortase [Patescibacteria group bacterium]